MKIYVASSWRNEQQPAVVAVLRELGAEVYDFRNPAPENHGFHWSEIDPTWKAWDPEEFREALANSIAQQGFKKDREALESCDICILVLPSGRSAHLEAGFAAGSGKTLITLLAPGEPELMYLLGKYICIKLSEVVSIVSLHIKRDRLQKAARL